MGVWEHGAKRACFHRSAEQADDGGLFWDPVCCASGIPVYAPLVSKLLVAVHKSLALEHFASDHALSGAASHGLLLYALAAVSLVSQHLASGYAPSALQHFAADHVLLDAASRGLLLHASADA